VVVSDIGHRACMGCVHGVRHVCVCVFVCVCVLHPMCMAGARRMARCMDAMHCLDLEDLSPAPVCLPSTALQAASNEAGSWARNGRMTWGGGGSPCRARSNTPLCSPLRGLTHVNISTQCSDGDALAMVGGNERRAR
jgi:hypothetical protein